MSANNETNPEMKRLDVEDQEDGRVQPVENRGKIFGISKTLLISLVVLLGVLAVAVSIGALVTSSQPAKKDCKGDKFNTVKYNYSDAGKREERFLKYLFVEDEEIEDFYDFAKAKERCHNLSATLWEIQDGQVEWDTLIGIAKNQKEKSESMWINAEPEGSCPEGADVCLEPEAAQGKGLAVRWPSFPRSTYSRLYKPATPDKKCIVVDSRHQELLWTTGNCKTTTAAALCVKRDCEDE